MTAFIIALVLCTLVAFIIGACRLASLADQQAEREYNEWLVDENNFRAQHGIRPIIQLEDYRS